MTISIEPLFERHSRRGEPTWEMVDQFPRQGDWTEAEYLALDMGRIVEFDQGVLEIHGNPTILHQRLVMQLLFILHAYLQKNPVGEALVAPMPLRTENGRYREPDLMLVPLGMSGGVRHLQTALLCVEVITPGAENRERDLQTKRTEYVAAGIPEYWIVDPETESLAVYVLTENTYPDVPPVVRGQQATSTILPGFTVDAAQLFDTCKSQVESQSPTADN